jgi:transposase InsO family protein
MIEELSKAHAVRDLCEFLEVSRSGYYAWKNGQESSREKANRVIVEEIKQVFQAKRERYGSPRVTHELRRSGRICNHKRVERLMRQEGSGRAGASGGRFARPRATMTSRSRPTCC